MKFYLNRFLFLSLLVVLFPLNDSLGETRREEWQPPDKIMDAIGVKPGMVIGEPGAGRGYMTFYLAKRVGKEGKVYRGDERLVRSKWCAYTAKSKAKPEADGKEITVAMFDHPNNERHPATWFTMSKPFAYLSATLSLHEEPFKLIAGSPLKLRYAVAIWDARPETEQIEKTYKTWAETSRMN